MNDIDKHDQEFINALTAFHKAGMRLCEAWGEADADRRWPLPEKLRPPMSLDEWLDELLNHFHSGSSPEGAKALAAAQACPFEHDDLVEKGELCPSCDTGICGDCDRIIYYVESEGWYRHATNVLVGCFLIGPEDEEGNALPRPILSQTPAADRDSVAVQYAEPDPQARLGAKVDMVTFQGESREIGESEGPYADYDKAYKNLATLGLSVFDGSGCLWIPLGTEVYGLVDFDGGEYRVGLYFEDTPDGGQDEEGVCARFRDFESTRGFIERLRKVHAPTQVTA